MLKSRSRYGYTGCAGERRDVFGPGAKDRKPITRIPRRTRLRPTQYPMRRKARAICRDPYQGALKYCSSMVRIPRRLKSDSPRGV